MSKSEKMDVAGRSVINVIIALLNAFTTAWLSGGKGAAALLDSPV
jgi:hypothetical protein